MLVILSYFSLHFKKSIQKDLNKSRKYTKFDANKIHFYLFVFSLSKIHFILFLHVSSMILSLHLHFPF